MTPNDEIASKAKQRLQGGFMQMLSDVQSDRSRRPEEQLLGFPESLTAEWQADRIFLLAALAREWLDAERRRA